jgi:hypothetical protein
VWIGESARMPSMRWSLARMFAMTALVAVASLAAKYGVAGPNVFCLLAVPVLVGAAVGTLAGRVGLWIRHGLAADVVLIGLALLDRMTIALILLAAVVLTAARDLWRLRRGPG